MDVFDMPGIMGFGVHTSIRSRLKHHFTASSVTPYMFKLLQTHSEGSCWTRTARGERT